MNFFRMEKTSPVRKQKILELIDFNMNVLKLMNQAHKLIITEKAKEKLLQYAWPGEEKELEVILEKAAVKCKNGIVEPEDIDIVIEKKDLEFPVGLKLENVEREYILQTLYFVQQNRTKAADILGISIRTLRNKLNQYRMEGHL